jgi:hypothetical protein
MFASSKPAFAEERRGAPWSRFWGLGFDASPRQRLHDRFWMAGKAREMGSRGAVRAAASLLPILKRRAGRGRSGVQSARGMGCSGMA